MIKNVNMKRELFGTEISQQSKTEFFSATDLVKAGNKWRRANGYGDFNLSLYLKSKSFVEFKKELDSKYGKSLSIGRGRSAHTWCHPLVFIDIALAINPKLKIEVYEWLFDNLIKYRNDSGDSYREMSAALYLRYSNKREFPEYIKKVANFIKQKIGVKNWETASEEQLRKRDLIHNSIKLLCNVLNSPNDAVRIGVEENLKQNN